jgi:hypothetical protein
MPTYPVHDEILSMIVSHSDKFYEMFDHTQITLLDTSMRPLTSKWSEDDDPLHRKMYWYGLVTSNVTIPMYLHKGGFLSMDGDAFPGTYVIHALTNPQLPDMIHMVGPHIYLDVELTLTPPPLLDNSTTTVHIIPNVDTTYRVFMKFTTLPIPFTNHIFQWYPDLVDTCSTHTFSYPLLCTYVCHHPQKKSNTGFTINLVMVSVLITALVVIVLCRYMYKKRTGIPN